MKLIIVTLCTVLMVSGSCLSVFAEDGSGDYVPSPERNEESGEYVTGPGGPEAGSQDYEAVQADGSADSCLMSPQTGEAFPWISVLCAAVFGVFSVCLACLGIKKRRRQQRQDK